jgi:hypothetical protein
MLLGATNRLSCKQPARLHRVLAAADPTGEIGAAWTCKEFLRHPLAEYDLAASSFAGSGEVMALGVCATVQA